MASIRRPVGQRRHAWRYFAVVSALALSGAEGCGDREAGPAVTDPGVTRTAAKGPVIVTLTASPATLDFEQRAQLTLEIIAEKGVTVVDNEYRTELENGDRRFEYRVVRSDKASAAPTADGKLRWTYRYDVEFFLPGEYELPGAAVSFVDLSAADDPEAREPAAGTPAEVETIETQPLTLVVRPPPGPALSEAELRTITRLDPIELSGAWSRWWWALPVFVALIVLAVVAFMRRARRVRLEDAVQLPAHEWAQQQIAALVADDLIRKGRLQEFYYRISGIVRGYIERRFGLSAPEMTTEEFLASAGVDPRFRSDTTEELNRFLGACDLVKYACHRPAQQESDAVLRAAGDYVARTRRRAQPTDEDRAVPRTELRAG